MADDKTFTQAEMDSIIEGRLARERQKYADYEDLREKASKYDEYQEQSKTELQKEKEKSDALQAKLTALALPFEVDLIAEAYVTISQNQSVVIDKSLSELTCAGKTLTVKLSQEDTLKLQQSEFKTAEVQIRVRMKSGDALASDIMRLYVGRILKEGVI